LSNVTALAVSSAAEARAALRCASGSWAPIQRLAQLRGFLPGVGEAYGVNRTEAHLMLFTALGVPENPASADTVSSGVILA
jgi:hypothetical protein